MGARLDGIAPSRQAESSAERNALLAALVETAEDAILALAPDGTVTSWNRGAETIFGYAAEEILGQPVALLADPARPGEMAAAAQRVLQGERIGHYETVLVRRDGKPVRVSLAASAIHDHAGARVGVAAIVRETAQRQAANEPQRGDAQYARRLIEASQDPLIMISPTAR